MTLDAARWSERLGELVRAHGVPGATLAVHAHGELTTCTAGYVNTATRVEATTDAVFPIASISKVWTAAAAMRLVERGLLDLDEPLGDVLPELRLPVCDGEPAIALRHLLSHTSGIDMDNFVDTGRGADALERYVATCSELQRLTAPGVAFSYGNAGFNIAGRMIERVTGQVWDDAMRDLLFEPLGLERTITLPEDGLLHRTAVGHLGGRPAAGWPVPRSAGPAGGIFSSASDLIRFARLHLDEGIAASGERLLSAASVAAMQECLVRPLDARTADGWGLGWMLLDWDGTRVIGHDGGSVGITAFLRIVPSTGTAIALMHNGGDGTGLYRALLTELLSELHGIAPTPIEQPPAERVALDLDRYVGVYRRPSWQLDVEAEGDRLVATLHVEEPVSTELGADTIELELEALDATRFVERRRGSDEAWSAVAFVEIPDHGRFVHMSWRTTPIVP